MENRAIEIKGLLILCICREPFVKIHSARSGLHHWKLWICKSSKWKQYPWTQSTSFQIRNDLCNVHSLYSLPSDALFYQCFTDAYIVIYIYIELTRNRRFSVTKKTCWYTRGHMHCSLYVLEDDLTTSVSASSAILEHTQSDSCSRGSTTTLIVSATKNMRILIRRTAWGNFVAISVLRKKSMFPIELQVQCSAHILLTKSQESWLDQTGKREE